jgi:hypothetical protein
MHYRDMKDIKHASRCAIVRRGCLDHNSVSRFCFSSTFGDRGGLHAMAAPQHSRAFPVLPASASAVFSHHLLAFADKECFLQLKAHAQRLLQRQSHLPPQMQGADHCVHCGQSTHGHRIMRMNDMTFCLACYAWCLQHPAEPVSPACPF